MPVIRTILTVIYFIIALIVTVLAFIQSTGSSSSNFYEKNKTRTKAGKLKKWTVIFAVIFTVLTIVLGILYMMK